MVRLKYESRAVLAVFLILPLAYYVLEYAFTVYTDLLYTGGAVILEFVDSFIVLLYVVFSLLTVEILRQKGKAERENLMLSVAAAQAQKELARISAPLLRPHSCGQNFYVLFSTQNEILTLLFAFCNTYINEICSRIESCSVLRYCKNEAVNIILSYYAEKAREKSINISVNVTAEDFSRFQPTDLCSLISNALENAVHGCEKMENGYIKVKIYEKNKKLCINIANSLCENIVFENHMPVAKNAGHGIGVKSMASVVEKYGGVYGFFADGNEFRFQASM